MCTSGNRLVRESHYKQTKTSGLILFDAYDCLPVQHLKIGGRNIHKISTNLVKYPLIDKDAGTISIS